jgi:hypothetical protein
LIARVRQLEERNREEDRLKSRDENGDGNKENRKASFLRDCCNKERKPSKSPKVVFSRNQSMNKCSSSISTNKRPASTGKP